MLRIYFCIILTTKLYHTIVLLYLEKEMIETLRLFLRSIRVDDALDIYEYSKNPNVGIHAGWKPHASLEETCLIMDQVFLNQPNVFGIELKESNILIGSIGLVSDPKRQNDQVKMLGYAIGQDYWGKGYTTEAAEAIINYGFNCLNLDLISAYCYPYNKRSKRVIEKCGFFFEGILRLSERRFDGLIYDHECYSIKR